MMHGISEQEWMEYLGGTMAPAAAGRIQSHIETCPGCAELVREQRIWHDRMTKEAARVRWALELPEEDMARLLARTLAEIERPGGLPEEARRGRTTVESMLLMQTLMEPIFGAGTARMAMELAVRRSTTDPRGDLENSDWPLFVTNLSETVATFCGSAARRLVSCAGVCLGAGG